MNRLLLLLCSLLFLASCATGPNPADVAADRARWTAVRDVTVDGTVDAAESPLLAQLLIVWDEKLAADEVAAGKPRDFKAVLFDLLRVYGIASVQVFLGPELQQRAPEAFRLIDKNSNGILEQEELMALDPADPVFAIVVVTTLHRLITEYAARGR